MSFFSDMDGRKAYKLHLAGNRLLDLKKNAEADEKFKEALSLYEKATEAGCAQARILMAYGVLLLRKGQFEKAREVMLKTEKAPGITAAEKRQLRLNFAICQWKLGKLDSAIEQMRRVAQDGMNSTIYGSLGYMLIEKAIETGDFDEAVAFNNEAYDYDDEDAVTLDNLGQLNLAMGEREKAYAYFLRAIERKPTQADTLFYLAKLKHEDGDDEAARGYLNTALEKSSYSALCTTTREQAEALLHSLKAQ